MTEFPLPTFVGLCPSDHVDEFCMPLDSAAEHICPACDKPLTIYGLMPVDRRIEYRVVNGKGLPVGGPSAWTWPTAKSMFAYWRGVHPDSGFHLEQRTITVGPWTDVEGDETDE
jgi:hypothetical protein